MLYIALWDAPDEPRRSVEVLKIPAIKRYVEHWGRDEDFGLIAMADDNDVGAIWSRLDGYDQSDGFGCDYPTLGIAVFETSRGYGAGSFLMSSFISSLKHRVPGLRLGVHPKNEIASRMYRKFGFEEFATGRGGYSQMKLRF